MRAFKDTNMPWIVGWMFFCLVVVAVSSARGANGEVVLLELKGAVGPATASYVMNGIKDANDTKALCCVIQLDTPGGAVESMRPIVMAILESKVPVVVYVSPPGARAASAGVMITNAADVAAMAPATNIGAAHPVGSGGAEINETMVSKITNDIVANARSVAEKRGRNAEWVEKAIRESVSATETEALELNVIDLIARDLPELLEKLDGREIPGKGVLETKEYTVRTVKESLREKILKTISDPNIAFILMTLGMLGLYFEFASPGAIFPGVLGAISLLLAFYAFQTLPVNYAGVLLILLAGVLFILETQIASHGALAIGGTVSMFLGATMLFDYEVSGMRVAWSVLIPTVAFVSAFFIIVVALVVKAHKAKIRTGEAGIVGETGQVIQVSSYTRGKVRVHAEMWNAKFSQPVEIGDYIRVVSVDGLLLTVEKRPEP
ncbi:MAG: nodulation protein NfeD [Desulfatibacillum sp.]|nr:nodulation protein NfeD [Desulfatibacillum sp.]